MAWTIIPNTDVDVDSPVTTNLMTALRDNVAAAFAGDTNAPAFTALIKPSSVLNKTITTSGSQAIGTGATWTPSAGLYNMTTSSNGMSFGLNVSASWRDSGQSQGGTIFMDGSNMRVVDVSGIGMTVYWQRFDG